MNRQRANVGPTELAVRRFFGNRPAALGLYVLVGLAAFSLFGGWLLPSPLTSDFSLSAAEGGPPGPSADHWLGTDVLLRDVLSRLAGGGRLSLGVSLAATLLAALVGTTIGLFAGLVESTRLRWLDDLVMRIVDALLAMPFLLVIAALGVAVGETSAWTVVVILGVLGWSGIARVVRAKTLELKRRDFVTAARALGASPLHTLWRHLLPNVATTVVVLASGLVAHMILAESALGYLGVGIPPPAPSWGRMLHEAEPYLGTRLTLVAAPAIAILLSVLAWNRVGDGLRDALDPQGGVSGRSHGLPIDVVMVVLVVVGVALSGPNALRTPPAAAEDKNTHPESPIVVRGGTLRLATFVNVRNLDPAVAYDEGSRELGSLVFAGMVRVGPTGDIEPMLAERVEPNARGDAFTVVLRPRLMFHDGSPLTSASVKRSMQRALDPRTASPGAHHYRDLAGYDAFRRGDADSIAGIETPDARTVIFRLDRPLMHFPALLTLGFAAPTCPNMGSFVDRRGGQPAHPCGAGPFRLESFDPEASATFVRHDDYFRPGEPYLDRIEWAINVPPRTQRYQFEDGSLDIVRDLSSTDAGLFRADPAWAPYGRMTDKLIINALFLNTERPPFDSVLVRRAVLHAIDPRVLERVRPDVQAIAGVVPPALGGPPAASAGARFDIEEARRLMAEAGLADGYAEPIPYVAVSGTFEQYVGEVVQQQLARIGLRVELNLMSYATYLSTATTRGQATMGWVGWGADFPDPITFFEPSLTSASIADRGSQNFSFFSHPELDRIVAQATAASGPQRDALFRRAEGIVADEAPWIPTYMAQRFELWQPWVEDFSSHSASLPIFERVWLREPRVRSQ